jgi:hypothetical protein
MTMNIRIVAGDIAQIAPVEADAAAFWGPHFKFRPWRRLCEKCMEMVVLEGDGSLEYPWDSDEDTLWAVSPLAGELCYLLAFSIRQQEFGCFGWEHVQETLPRALDRLRRPGVARIAIHMPMYEPDQRHRRMDYKRFVQDVSRRSCSWTRSFISQKASPGAMRMLVVQKIAPSVRSRFLSTGRGGWLTK